MQSNCIHHKEVFPCLVVSIVREQAGFVAFQNPAVLSSIFKVAAFTVLQYINLLNHKPIGQVKYALF